MSKHPNFLSNNVCFKFIFQKAIFKSLSASLSKRGLVHNFSYTSSNLKCVQFSLLETDAKVEESIHTLERTKDELLKQRELLEQKLQEGSLLDPKEERR